MGLSKDSCGAYANGLGGGSGPGGPCCWQMHSSGRQGSPPGTLAAAPHLRADSKQRDALDLVRLLLLLLLRHCCRALAGDGLVPGAGAGNGRPGAVERGVSAVDASIDRGDGVLCPARRGDVSSLRNSLVLALSGQVAGRCAGIGSMRAIMREPGSARRPGFSAFRWGRPRGARPLQRVRAAARQSRCPGPPATSGSSERRESRLIPNSVSRIARTRALWAG